ncbi:MAG: lysine biosynthesis protein LysX [Phycisphaerales bacterium]|nr:lysine biosynthesis protein LysX [Phycisphaerales bacterium]
MRIAMLHSRIRAEERLLLDCFDEIGVEITSIDLRGEVFDPSDPGKWVQFDAVLDRSMSLTHSRAAVMILEGLGVRCINPGSATEICSDKLATTIALVRAGLPTPGVRVGLTAETGLEAVEQIGYPCVLKPTVGSWGRLMARVNDRDAAEAVLEHRETLGSVAQRVMYAQEYIAKPDRDIRVFVVGHEPIAAIVRSSEHWVTNTARGAQAAGLPLNEELRELAARSSHAVGADLCAIDLLECPRRGLLVNEINHSMEFRNSIETTGVNIPMHIARHAIRIAESACASSESGAAV